MPIGKVLIIVGIILIAVGILWTFIGKLPGDFTFKRGNTVFYFPVMTSIVVSVVLTILFYLFSRFR